MVVAKGMVVTMGKVGHRVVAVEGWLWPRGWWGPWGRLATEWWP